MPWLQTRTTLVRIDPIEILFENFGPNLEEFTYYVNENDLGDFDDDFYNCDDELNDVTPARITQPSIEPEPEPMTPILSETVSIVKELVDCSSGVYLDKPLSS